MIPIYAEEITISKKLVKVGEILLSKRRVIEEENVNVDTTKERISVEHPDGRKEKLTGYWKIQFSFFYITIDFFSI